MQNTYKYVQLDIPTNTYEYSIQRGMKPVNLHHAVWGMYSLCICTYCVCIVYLHILLFISRW